MPYVSVPKDLTKVKTKIMFGLTKRQLICFSAAAVIGVPVFFLSRGAAGNSAAVLLMIGVMLPAFFLAMYEKDGQPAEKILIAALRSKWYYPQARPYVTNNLYKILEEDAVIDKRTKAGTTPKNGKASASGE